MKFFLDANIPYSALEVFKELNLESLHARDAGLSRADDKEIIDYAIKNNSVLVTKDLEFANIKVSRRIAPRNCSNEIASFFQGFSIC